MKLFSIYKVLGRHPFLTFTPLQGIAAQVKGEKENVSYVLKLALGLVSHWDRALAEAAPASPGSRTSVIYRAAAAVAATAGRYLCETCQTV